MILYGLNVAAFKLPIEVPVDSIIEEMEQFEDCFIPHNMQIGQVGWETVSLKGALGNWSFSDPAFYQWRPEMNPFYGSDHTKTQRLKYLSKWAYTELSCFAPRTTNFVKSLEGLGSFLNGARFLKVNPESHIDFHADNNPHKEFRVTIGLSGIEDEDFVIQTSNNKLVTIPMKVGEAWFVDISLGHAVYNLGKKPRYRLGLQYYSPTSDALLEMFKHAKEDDIIYSKHIVRDADLET